MDTLNLKEWHKNGEILRTHLFFGGTWFRQFTRLFNETLNALLILVSMQVLSLAFQSLAFCPFCELPKYLRMNLSSFFFFLLLPFLFLLLLWLKLAEVNFSDKQPENPN